MDLIANLTWHDGGTDRRGTEAFSCSYSPISYNLLSPGDWVTIVSLSIDGVPADPDAFQQLRLSFPGDEIPYFAAYRGCGILDSDEECIDGRFTMHMVVSECGFGEDVHYP